MTNTSHRSPLLSHIQYHAKQRVKHGATFAGSQKPYNRWLWLVASEFGLNYGKLVSECELMARYYEYSLHKGYWSEPVRLFYKPDVFERQLSTLVEAIDTEQPVARVAARRAVSFQDFEFSVSLLDAVVWRTARLPIIDFSGLIAPGSVITQSWAISCAQYAGADLENCKFVDVFCDPSVGPGTNIYRGDFKSANLAGSDLRRAYLRGSDFRAANLMGADLRGAQHLECKFDGATGDFELDGLSDLQDVHSWLIQGATS